jgi:hypothetical protein
MSNAIRYDTLLVHYLAAELHGRLRARRLRGVRLDPDARRFVLELDGERLVWELHPRRGWLRVVNLADAGSDPDAVEGWGGRSIRTQRRPRIRRVTAPPDERWLEVEIDAGGRDRASRFVVELMTNQWNVLALEPEGTILAALHARQTSGRRLRTGAPYVPPAPAGGAPREGIDGPVTLDRWLELLVDVPPADRGRTLVRAVAWMSPLNAVPLLGDAARDGGEGEGALKEAWERYVTVASLPPVQPRLLDLGQPTPYPLPLPGVRARLALSLLAALDEAAPTSPAALAPEVLVALEARLERVRRHADRLHAEAREAPGKARALRKRADLLMAQLHRVRKGATTVELDDFEGGSVVVELDPTLGPAENAQRLYERARKRDRAATRLPDRVRAAVAERNRLESLLADVEAGRADPKEVRRWVAAVRPSEGGAAQDEERLPYRRFRSSGGLEIRVGRTSRANDELTFRHASPEDVWLHARDSAGAHVILRWSDRERNPPGRDLLEAAVLAALHSRARTSGTVPVDWTRRKHVRKPRKANPGAVIADRVATLFVEPDPSLPDRLARDPEE